MTDDGQGDYPVGYRRPPRHTQFKKGVSGNPRGRPRGSPNIATALREALRERVIVRESDGTKMMTKLEVAVTQIINKAATGDHRAFKLITQLLAESADGSQQPITIVISEAQSAF